MRKWILAAVLGVALPLAPLEAQIGLPSGLTPVEVGKGYMYWGGGGPGTESGYYRMGGCTLSGSSCHYFSYRTTWMYRTSEGQIGHGYQGFRWYLDSYWAEPGSYASPYAKFDAYWAGQHPEWSVPEFWLELDACQLGSAVCTGWNSERPFANEDQYHLVYHNLDLYGGSLEVMHNGVTETVLFSLRVVPEPRALGLLCIALMTLAFATRRRRSQPAVW